jgi:5-methylcytosine-specific restriction endonuclease McrA
MAFSPQERADAISRGAKKYFTGRACKSGHVAERRTSNGCCVVCEADKHQRWAKNNPEKLKEASIKSYAKHAEKRRQKAAEYRASNPEAIKLANTESKKKNRAYHTYLESQRQQRIKQATPAWLGDSDKDWMVSIYKKSQDIKRQYDVATAVDHIVPIKGKNVCGLNVPWNLRVTTQKYNSAKWNSLEENLPIYQSQGSIMIHESALPWTLRS